MNSNTLLVFGLVLVLISCVFFTGCADDSGTNTTTQVTSAPGSPKYVTGDIVRNPAYETAWLILGYNSSTDSYQRALIYANADGSWGYRTNSNSDTVTRAVFEKTNTEKITNKPPSSIVIRRPTTVATTRTTVTTSPTGNTTTTTTTTTTMNTTVTGKPTFKKIVPDEGTAGTTVTITSLTGTNFKSGAIVQLTKEDNPNITATNVDVLSPTLMTCTFAIPANTTPGAWDVVITNTDGLFVKYAYIFSVRSAVGTSTTTSSSDSGITSIAPVNSRPRYLEMAITGSNFQIGIKGKLTRSTNNIEILANDCNRKSETQVTCWFNILDTRPRGFYNVILTNPDGTTRSLPDGFELKA